MKSFIHSCAKSVGQDSFLSLTFEFYALFSGKHEITTDTFGLLLTASIRKDWIFFFFV